jgi:AcrR family transcriptional regulator
VPTPSIAFRRARRPEQKQARLQSILEAARRLGARDGIREVTLGDIAADVGMHPSALLRYFETREEIFLRIAAEEWRDWLGLLREALEAVPRGDAAGVSAAIARTLARRQLFCDLLAHASLNLERHVSPAAVRAFKEAAHEVADEIATRLCEALPRLTRAAAFDLVLSVGMIAAGLWQAAHPPPALATLYEQEPQLGHLDVAFEPTIARLTETVLIGLLARGAPAS